MTIPERERKRHKQFNYHSGQTGRTTVQILCPFCGQVVVAYVWSLAGHGKKCPCGAIHYYFGTSLAPIKKE